MNGAEKGRSMLRPYNGKTQSWIRIRRGCACSSARSGNGVVGAEVFLGVDAGDLAHFAVAVGGDPKRNRQPQDPGSQTEPGAPLVFLSVESMA